LKSQLSLLKKLLFLILVVGMVAALTFYYLINVAPALKGDEKIEVLIRKGDSFANVEAQLTNSPDLKYGFLLRPVAKALKYDLYVKPGRYLIQPGSSIFEIIRKLRSGNQDAINVTLNNITFLHQLAGKVAAKLDIDSTDLANTIYDSSIAQKYGFSKESFAAMFLCNTYSFFWNTSVEGFLERMHDEYQRFWNDERTNKALKLNLKPEEVIILASIVNKETNYRAEYPKVAGVYLNRLRKGMLLQADPTVKFAVGDMAIRRVLNTHLQTDSPYNTYMYVGLPPGPICLPELDVIEGVLNAQQHDYLYFCAIYGSGQHAFAVSYDQHLKNAREYHQTLNRQKIYR
jgi:UPF0755 protein